MDFSKTSQPRFHQAAMATAFTLSIVSPLTSWAAQCDTPANPFVVNIATNSDDPCDDQISLQEAVTYANDHLGHDTITFAPALNGQRISAPETAINVSENLSITGPKEPDLITLELSETDSLFDIKSLDDASVDFNLSNTIFENAAGYGNHHIIDMKSFKGDITLDNIHTTSDTRATGIFTSNVYNAAQDDTLNLTLKNSRISGSHFSNNILSVYNWTDKGNIHIAIEDTEILDNQAGTIADINNNYYNLNRTASIGIARSTITGNNLRSIATSHTYHYQGSENIEVSQTTISQNTLSSNGLSAYGVNGKISLHDSRLCHNKGTRYASLISTRGATHLDISKSELCNNQAQLINLRLAYNKSVKASIKDSLLANNNSYSPAFKMRNYTNSTLDLNIINSTFSGNKSAEYGGAIALQGDNNANIDLHIHNSTLSDNHGGYDFPSDDKAPKLSSAIEERTGAGGAVWVESKNASISVDISSSTISHNSTSEFGGGIVNIGGADVLINNSIVANNTANNGTDHDLFGQFNVENSIIGDTTTTDSTTTINGTVIDQIGNGEGQTADTGHNILGQDPLLQELALSGGTWVHQLNAESPAIGAGNADAENLAEFDQRGEGFKRVRTVNDTAQLDIGAVQYFAKPVAVNDVVSVEQNSINNALNVLTNDARNSDGIALDVGSVVIMSHPEHGSAYVKTDGTIVYTPSVDFFGDDSFTYVVQDINSNTSSEAAVNITVSELVIPTPEEPILEEPTVEPKEENSSGSSGGGFNLWFLSILGLIGLRRRTH